MAYVTTNSVQITANTVLIKRKFGAAAIDGNTVYLDVSDSNRWKQADSGPHMTGTNAEQAGQDGIGILVHDVAAADEYGLIAVGGTIHIEVNTGSLVKGSTYIVGDGAGSLAEDGDITVKDNYKTIIGVAGENNVNGSGSDELHLDIHVSNKQIP